MAAGFTESLLIKGPAPAPRYVNLSFEELAETPPAVVTVTFTAPALLAAGSVAVISVFETSVKEVAASVPKSTAVALDRFAPPIVTSVLPPSGPDVGLMLVTLGAAT